MNNKNFPHPTLLICLATLLLLLLISPPLTWGGSPEIILRIHGSNTIGAKLGPDLASRFFSDRGYINISRKSGVNANEYLIIAQKEAQIHAIEIKAHGSSTGFKSLNNNECEIAMSSRRIKDKEVEELSFLGDMTSVSSEHVLAIDGIAVIVHKNNPIDELNIDLIKHLFTGKVKNWQEIGGRDAPVKVYARDDNSGTYDTFKEIILGKTPLLAGAERFESNADLSDEVAGDENGIGFVGMPYVRNAKAITVKNSAGSPGVYPTTFTAAYEEYPIARRLYLYTASEPENPLAKDFTSFALSDKGQKSVALLGFAKLSMAMERRNINTARFQQENYRQIYSRETLGGRRINFNFRFNTGDNSLENRSVTDLERLITFIQQRDQYYYQLLLVGINSCYQTEKMYDTILEKTGREYFRVLPHKICLDYATDPGGQPLHSLIEVWLRIVNDGA